MYHKTILLAILAAVAVSAIYPVRNYYAQKRSLAALPDYTSYAEAVFSQLAPQIRKQAAAEKCRSYVRPLEEIQASDTSLPNVVEDINLALSSYKKWRLVVDSETEARIKKRKDQMAKDFQVLDPGAFIKEVLFAKKAKVSKTRYSVKSSWAYDKSVSPNNVKLIVIVVDDRSETELFRATVAFLHPEKERELRQQFEKRKKQRASLASAADFSMKLFWGFNFILAAYLLAWGANSTVQRKRRQATEQLLLAEIQKKDLLIENGHFVTAFELAEKHLKYFPNDSEIKAFKERISDFTNNDPKTAQVAYVEAQKLKLRLEQYKQSGAAMPRLIEPGEKDAIAPLLPYNRDLDRYYGEVLLLEDKERKEQEFGSKLERVNALLNDGYLNKSEEELAAMQRNYPEKAELHELQDEIKRQKAELESTYAEVESLFKGGQMGQAMTQLEDLLARFKDHNKALELQELLRAAKGGRQFRLSPAAGGKEVMLFCQSEVVVGRDDETEAPDIEFGDKRISRKHLRLSIVGHSMIAEDCGSAGGSFVNGKKIGAQKLKDGDLVNLAKTVDMTVSTDASGGTVSLVLDTRDRSYLVAPSCARFEFDGNRLSPGAGENTIYHENEVTILASPDEFHVLAGQAVIKLGQREYQVEKIK